MSLSQSTMRRAIKDLGKSDLHRKEHVYRKNGLAISNRYYLNNNEFDKVVLRQKGGSSPFYRGRTISAQCKRYTN